MAFTFQVTTIKLYEIIPIPNCTLTKMTGLQMFLTVNFLVASMKKIC